MAYAAPSPEFIARFRADLDALVGAGSGRIGVAVSGGPDSLALLLLAHAARPSAIAAATVDHRLRAESADEAAFVAGICAELGVPYEETTLVDSYAQALRHLHEVGEELRRAPAPRR